MSLVISPCSGSFLDRLWTFRGLTRTGRGDGLLRRPSWWSPTSPGSGPRCAAGTGTTCHARRAAPTGPSRWPASPSRPAPTRCGVTPAPLEDRGCPGHLGEELLAAPARGGDRYHQLLRAHRAAPGEPDAGLGSASPNSPPWKPGSSQAAPVRLIDQLARWRTETEDLLGALRGGPAARQHPRTAVCRRCGS